MSTFSVPTATAPPSTDLSGQLLEGLLGNNWYDLQVGSDGLTSLFYHMIGTVNVTVVTIIASYLSYVVLVESMGTASEGKVGGKHDLMWTPLRMGYSIAMSAPVTQVGACVGQILLLYCVAGSINAANTLWNAGLDFFEETGMTTIVSELPPALKDEFDNAGQAMFEAQVYQKVAEIMAERQGKDTTSTCDYNYDEDSGEHVLSFTFPEGTPTSSKFLGKITIPAEENDPVAIARVNGLMSAYVKMGAAADSAAHGIQPGSGFMEDAEKAYSAGVNTALQNVGSTYSDSAVMQEIRAFADEGRLLGWFAAGAYTMQVARLQEKVNDTLFSVPEVVPPQSEKFYSVLSDPLYNDLTTVTHVASAALTKEYADSLDSESPDGFWEEFKEILSLRIAPRTLINMLSKGDPFLTFAYFGEAIMACATTAITTYAVLYGTAAAAETMANVAGDSVLAKAAGALSFGIGTMINGGVRGTASGAKATMGFFTLPIIVGGSALFMLGFFAAYALPALPFFYWVYAVMGWVLLVIEAMVAWPFWMLGHAFSKQHGFAGESAKQGYMLFLEIMIRPALMVLGLAFSYSAMTVVGQFIGKLLLVFMDSTYYNDSSIIATVASPISSIAMLIIVVIVYWKVMHMFFTRGVAHLPRNVTKWIGGSGSMTQAEQQAGDTHRTLVAGMNRTGTAAAQGIQAGKNHMKMNEVLNQDEGDGENENNLSDPHMPKETPGKRMNTSDKDEQA